MRIGLDFDNTIVGYDRVFHRCAVERGLIPPTLPASKTSVRDHVRAHHGEEEWTTLQGYVYGPGMIHAEAFPGALKRIAAWVGDRIPVFIISLKTRYSCAGPRYDLHAAAWDWLERQGFFDRVGLHRDHVHFEETRDDKLRRIAAVGCTHFVDDLPELLGDSLFPAGVARLLFDPNETYPAERRFSRVRSWAELAEVRP